MIKTLLITTLLATPALQASAPDGKTLYATKLCVTCHGADGKPTAPIYPTIFGKDTACLEKEYKLIMDGTRKGMAATMKAMVAAQKLTDAEIKAVLAYAAKQKIPDGLKDPATTKCKVAKK